MPKIAVLGGTGYLASILENQNNTKQNKFTFFSRKKSCINYINFSKFEDSYSKLKKYDFIIHLIGPSQSKINNENKLLKEKKKITSKISDLCFNNNIKLIYISSLKVYKNYGNRSIFNNSKINLDDFYSRSHYESEKIIKKKFKKHKNMFTILRFGNVFGYRKYLNLNELNKNIIHEFCKSALYKKKIIVKNGTVQRAFIPSEIFVDIINKTIKKKIFKNSIKIISYKIYNLKEFSFIIEKRFKKIFKSKIKVVINNYKSKKKNLIVLDREYKINFNTKKIYKEIDQVLKNLK